MPSSKDIQAALAKPNPVPTFPDRDAWKKVELSRNSHAHDLQGREPGFQYESFSLEPDHPSYIGKRIVPHEIGDQRTGFVTVAAWEPCTAAVNAKVTALEVRTDQGKPIDTTVRYGRQITCRIPMAEYAKYEAVDKRRSAQRHKDLFETPDHVGVSGARVTTVNTENENTEWQTELVRAGHPMPGQQQA